jgi:hypothetical protein
MRFLARLFPSQDIEALVGDIAEESRRRWVSLTVTPGPAPPPGTVTRPLFDTVDMFAIVASILLGGCMDQRA